MRSRKMTTAAEIEPTIGIGDEFCRQDAATAAAAAAAAADTESDLQPAALFVQANIRREPQLTPDEKQFLLFVERGDMAKTRRKLPRLPGDEPFEDDDANPNLPPIPRIPININCTDPLGRTALHIAIENENIEMVELLLQHNAEVGDSLLHAINEENVEAVELILLHEENRGKPLDKWAGNYESSSFPPDVTPLMLAAHRDNYEIIKILLDRGARIPQPHDSRCACNECITSRSTDSLRHSHSRIHAYRALASPSLIALSSKDPILTAFQLSWELRGLSNRENEFKQDYIELSKQCEDFATALLNQVRSSDELEIVLNHDAGNAGLESGKRMNLSRLKMAIRCKQKKFVAHPNCQQLLASIFYEGLPGFRRANICVKSLLVVCIGLMFPVFSVLYLIAPKSRIGGMMRQPFIKFLCHSASYICFLGLLILASQRIESLIDTGDKSVTGNNSTATKNERRGPPPTFVEAMIVIWVAGLIWVEVKQLWDVGIYEYLHDMWNFLDFVTNSLYVAVIALRIVAYLQVQHEKSTGNNAAFLERKRWDAYDPTLISEGLFAAANIFSSLRLVYIFSINPHLGPLQISLGRMVVDIMKFFFFISLVLFSFTCGLNQLMWYYADMRAQECNQFRKEGRPELESSCQPRYKSFSNLWETLQTLIWAIFGLIDLDHLDLKEDHSYTEFVGRLMFGTYSVISIIVLLNMLIAMMSNSYQLISNQSDTEWKFARSKLWMSYFEEGSTLPTPFNIIPSPKSAFYVIRWAFRKIGACCGKFLQRKWSSTKMIKKITQREAKYQAVVRNLVKRYVTNMQRTQQAEGVSEDDVNEIKQDISSFRYELLHILQQSGMNTSSATNKKGVRASRKQNRQERRLMKGFQIQPSIPEFEMSPSSSLPNLLDDGNDSPADYSNSPGNKRSPMNRLKISKFRFNVPRGPTQASRQWDLLLRAAKKRKENPNPQLGNHTDSSPPSTNAGQTLANRQTVIDVKSPTPPSGPTTPLAAPLAVQEGSAVKLDPLRAFHKPYFKWKSSPSSSTEDQSTLGGSSLVPPTSFGSPATADSIASLIYQTRELSPLFTHSLVNETVSAPTTRTTPVLSSQMPTSSSVPGEGSKRKDIPQPYLSSITML
ncbi:transient receptor potential-gamma protein-like isoform X2 [Paramacrobiotus metropolitanus]|uniref:transient receptor potential-gamma protein-like isoform X2 n=1 Tax=Paramacrobiotus metropolitanus TaxID=2943436 RepID=UPI002445FDE7|nr:transient receptor potential-gamma protein-like isoform X2 [Paramacrobiotus metropolitanus]